jgi:cytochrome c biogenesis protein CcmG/thiol:disulfide interchange protein DsbE
MKIKDFIPLISLILLVLIIAVATKKIDKKQNLANQKISENSEIENERFSTKKIALADFSLPNLYQEGVFFTKKDLKKNYKLINIFASWCTTCHFEHQKLMMLSENKMIEIYGIAWNDIKENARSYLAKNGNPYQITAIDNQQFLTNNLSVKAIPESFLMDENNNIILRISGNLDDLAIEEIQGFVNKK